MQKKALTAGSCSSSYQGYQQEPNPNPSPNPNMNEKRRKTRPAGHPDPDAEVVALQPEDLLAVGRYVCSVCGKGFQRDQNLQLHLRSHNVACELRRGGGSSGGTPARRKAYVCPVATCVYSDRSRALSDITGIKKHFNRKHGTKNLLCPRCSRPYAVEADLKAHIKTHGAGGYRCECGAAFSRRNTYEAHRGFCCKLLAAATCVTGESSARAGAASFSGTFELPDMNEKFVHPDDGFTSYEEAPQDEVMAEQPNANLAATANQDAAALSGQQLRVAMVMMPEDPDFVENLPPCLTEMLKAHYEEVFGGFLPATSPAAVGNRSMPSSPSHAGLSEENVSSANSSALNFFGGSSSSFMEYGAAPSSQGSPDLRANLPQSNYTHNGDFLNLLLTPAMAAPDPFNGNDDPMLASSAFTNSNSMDQPYQAGTLPESSATALLRKAGLIRATMNGSYLNLFQLQQKHNQPTSADALPSNFLTLMPSAMTAPSKTAASSTTQQQESRISNPSSCAFSIYRQDKSSMPSNTTSASSSFFGAVIKSMDAYSQQKESGPEKAPATFLDFFTGSKPTPEAGAGPEPPLMPPHTFSSTIAPRDGGMVTNATERGGLRRAEAAAPPPTMSRKGKEVVGDGQAGDVSGEGGGEGAGHYDEQEAGFFFGGANGHRRRFF